METQQEKHNNLKKKSRIWYSFKEPWGIIKRKPMSFFLFCLFTVFAGQIGILINIIIRVSSEKFSLVESLYLDSVSGSFYTFSIALIASALGPLFVNFVEKSPTEFRSIKITTISITIFILFFTGIFYSISTTNPESIGITSFGIDWPQLSFFLLAIVVSLFSFNLLELENFKDDYADINDDNYASVEDELVKTIVQSATHIKTDKKGNKL
ncbi:hypothetical protein B0A67_06160 [Flavobacterium aquidurense]|uniref:hypothetical protein n=1 Tax=Flavobacterium aquidurense TaxID=362413 RepID=UPI000918D5E0|nr:hypothetical protein [Flavobacterium aquidurense]OXA73024.1 hypothetical protein B0A67_06160 [Flavobacterium aquidurense]SHH17230.1 hypothetical protein SAMN05444481_112133 [Flavobacterium frigidimaris]